MYSAEIVTMKQRVDAMKDMIETEDYEMAISGSNYKCIMITCQSSMILENENSLKETV